MTATTVTAKRLGKAFAEPKSNNAHRARSVTRLLRTGTVTLFALMCLGLFLSPLAYMASTALKSDKQISDTNQPLLPKDPSTAVVAGKKVPVLNVPLTSGTRSLALVKKGPKESIFVDPGKPEEKITWVGNWRTLKPSYHLAPQWSNFSRAWGALNITLLLKNTAAIAILGMIGTVISSVLVAYGLSRFRVPFAKTIMATLVAAIILPRFLLITPLYAAYLKIGWIGTWWPLIIPHFFSNAYNVFLLRQFFLTIPAEIDEAAALDGAGPLKTLWSVIIPQARPAILVIALFHFYFAWNDFFEPYVYLASAADLQPISVGLYRFLGLYSVQLGLLQAGAALGMAIPVLVFIVFQRAFLRGIDLSGSTKG
ncbi:MAG: carbohydrate ABC transporter permease [Mycobacteriales bacterium]